MVVLGIDPGTATVGYGLIKDSKKRLNLLDYGCITTSKELPPSERLQIIHNQTTSLIRKHKPSVLVIEQLFFNANTKTATAVGRAAGVIMLAAARAKIPVFEYAPLQIKMSIDGYGRANKKKVQKRVSQALNLKALPKPDDAADALAVAICHLRSIYGKLKKERR